MRVVLTFAVVTGLVLAAGCGDDGGSAGNGPSVVVTSTILGDVVREVVGDAAPVEVLLPLGADPHEFAPSTRQVEAMAGAALLVVVGGGFEGGLDDAVDRAEDGGTAVFRATDHTQLLGDDPHVWTDPVRMAGVVEALAGALVDDAGLDEAGVGRRGADYADALREIDGEIDALLAPVPADGRVLVTNHEVLGYFADRYGFEVIGTVIPSLSTGAEPSAADIESLGELIEAAEVPAIFAETSSPTRLAEALADTAGEVEVVTLFTESLGGPGSGAETYLELLRTNARLIAGALGGEAA